MERPFGTRVSSRCLTGADSNFTGVVAWLESLERVPDERAASSRTRFHPVEASEDLLRTLVECLISLAVRSQMNREAGRLTCGTLTRTSPWERAEFDHRPEHAGSPTRGDRGDRDSGKVRHTIFAGSGVYFWGRLLPQHRLTVDASPVAPGSGAVDAPKSVYFMRCRCNTGLNRG